MTLERSQENLRQETAEAMSRQQAWPTVASPRPLRAGDLLMMTADDQRPDFWLVAKDSPNPMARLRLIPADVDPMCGTRDVVLPDDGTNGALTVRCGFAVWLDAATVRPLARAGSVPTASLEMVKSRLSALDAGEPTGTALDRDTEAELEYQDLVAELTEAREQLLANATPAVPAAAPSVAERTTAAWQFSRSLGLAASLLMALALGLIAGWAGRGRWMPAQPQPTPTEPSADLSFEWLSPRGQIRNQSTEERVPTLSLSPEAPYVALFLDVGIGGSDTEYRLDIHRQGSTEIWWSDDARQTGTAEIFVLLPTKDLEPGDYIFTLYDPAAPETPRFVYELRLERPASP